MLAAALIVFREALEAVMIIAIIAAATRGVVGRGRWIATGVGAGLFGAGLIAILAESIANMADGTGQELLNAGILMTAVLMIGWHVVWMNKHGRAMATEMRAVGKEVSEGQRHMSVLAIVIGMAVMREGGEVVLMLQGLLIGSPTPMTMVIGGALGLVVGILVGVLMYAGFMALPLGRVFAATNALLVLIAGGLAARSINFLVQAGWLPSLTDRVWDTSGFIADDSLVGQVLAALVGYIAQPSGIQLLAYGVTISGILLFLARERMSRRMTIIACTVAIIIGTFILALPNPASASSVKSPYVVQGEVEIEQQGSMSHDREGDNNGHQELSLAVGYSPTSFWKTEIEGEFERESGADSDLRYQAIATENTFQLAERGEYWIDPAVFVELGFERGTESNKVEIGFLGGKDIGQVSETFNLLLGKNYSPDTAPINFEYRNQLKYSITPWFEPGFELYGETDGKEAFAEQQLSIGPVILGKIKRPNSAQAIKYEVGYQLGATPATPDGTLRWKLEYEFYF